MFKHRKYRKYSDEELVVKVKEQQDMFCIGILYERYGHLVFGLSLKYLKNSNDAEDLTSKVFESLFQKLQIHTVQHFKSWLYMLSKNECLMLLRKGHKNNEIDIDVIQIEASNENLELEVRLDLLEKKIDLLKDEQQQCVRLFYLEEKSYQQISEQLNLPINKVKSAIQNGKRNLKILLEQHHEFK